MCLPVLSSPSPSAVPCTASPKKILVACEYSGIVSSALAAVGHDVTSCDLVPRSLSLVDNSNTVKRVAVHKVCDVRTILFNDWDVLIGFPPCTFLCKAQIGLLNSQEFRFEKTFEAMQFFKLLWFAPIKFKCLENPVGIIHRLFIPCSQIIYPHWFGSPYHKEICLWLQNLPPLIATQYNVHRRSVSNHVNGRMSAAEKSKIRSKFFPEVAQAMANQWQFI